MKTKTGRRFSVSDDVFTTYVDDISNHCSKMAKDKKTQMPLKGQQRIDKFFREVLKVSFSLFTLLSTLFIPLSSLISY